MPSLCVTFSPVLSQSVIEEQLSHHSFEDTVELGVDHFSYCVALYDYSKVNPNDMELE